LAFIGGTGPEGLGLAIRLAAAGEEIVIGSRLPKRAEAAAGVVRTAVAAARVDGCSNADAVARSERVFLTIPAGALEALLGCVAFPGCVRWTRAGSPMRATVRRSPRCY